MNRTAPGNLRTAPADALDAAKGLWAYATDARKWRKLALLARERRAETAHRLRGRTAPPAVPDPPTEHRWSYRSEVSVDEAMVANESIPSRQDVRVGPDRLLTELDYRVTALPEAVLVTNTVTHRSVYGADGTRVPDLSWGASPPARARLSLPVDRRLEGDSVSAYGNLAMEGGNYGHWLVDGAARLMLVERFRDLASFDRVVVPPARFDFHRDMLALFGFGPERTHELDALECARFERLTCTSAPRGTASAVCPGWVVDGYRERVGAAYGMTFAPTRGVPAGASGAGAKAAARGADGPRLYISRRDASSRRFVNEDEISEALGARDFETVELSAHDFAAKIRLFADAACVVGLSGAGMANAMFCRPDATVVELSPSGMVHYLTASMCSYVGCRHRAVPVDARSVLSGLNPFYGDMHMDVGTLLGELSELGF